MMLRNVLKYFLIILILVQGMLYAQTFSASVSSPKVGVNDRFELSFTFSGENLNGLKDLISPDLGNFIVLSGPNSSTSFQFINGVSSATETFTYYLKPKSVGTITIGSASIEYNGKTYKSDPVSVEIVKGSVSPEKKRNEEPSVDSEIAENLFVRAFADKRKVYQGEQVTITYKLYTRLNIASQMSVSKLPQYKGFWAEELESPKNILFSTETVNGKQFRVGVLKKVALFPNQAGELSVTPFELNVPVLVQRKKRSNNFFDDFFTDPFGRGETVDYAAKSNTLKIDALPLPKEGKPESFNGAVGDFTLSSSIDKSKTKTNEPVSLKIDIKGNGNMKLIDISEVKLPPGVEKYDPKVSEQINRTNKISGKKTMEYLIVPRTPGEKKIPGIAFSYFNPNKKAYVTLNTNPYTIEVEQGDRVFEPDISGLNKEDIELLSEDIRFIKTSDGDLSKKTELLVFRFGFWAAVGLPLIALIGLVTLKKRDEKLAANVQLLRYQKAQKVAKNRLKIARSLMVTKQDKAFYTELSLALFGYLEDKLHIPKSEFSVDRAVFELQKRKIDQDIVDRVQNVAQKCEYVRFAPGSDGAEKMNDMYNQLSDLIIDIEKSITTKKYV
jgi:hypothetical protein